MRVKLSSVRILLGVLSLWVLLPACGNGNVFWHTRKHDAKDEARNAINSNDTDTAISKLESWLADHPDDTEARSMLATALLSKANVDPVGLAAAVQTAKANGASTDFAAIQTAMPKGTATNVKTLQNAVDVLTAIPEADRTKEQNYQLAIAQASLAVTVLKTAAGNSTHDAIDVAQVDALTDADAATVTGALGGCASALSASGQSQDSGTGSGKLAKVSADIQAQSGSSTADKLKAYLKANLPST